MRLASWLFLALTILAVGAEVWRSGYSGYLPFALLFATLYLATLIESLRPRKEPREAPGPEKLIEALRENSDD
jgi:hypothetical protein